MGVVFSPLRRLTSLRRGETSGEGVRRSKTRRIVGGGEWHTQGRTWREKGAPVGAKYRAILRGLPGRETELKLTKMTRHLFFSLCLSSTRPVQRLAAPSEILQSDISTSRTRQTNRDRQKSAGRTTLWLVHGMALYQTFASFDMLSLSTIALLVSF